MNATSTKVKSKGKRKAAVAPVNGNGKRAAVGANFVWGSWFNEYLQSIKTKSAREEVRRGAFLLTNAYMAQGSIPNNAKNAIYELTHLNASHIAGLMGLWAELAIREGIRVAQQGARAASVTRGGSPTTRYTFNKPLRSPASRNAGNNLNAWNNITKSPRTVDYVMMKSDRYADRYGGISPFNFVFKDFISNTVKPWEHVNIRSARRDAHVTCFEKVRVDWNWVKLWCGADYDTLDWDANRDGTLFKAHSLPNHGNPTAGGKNGNLTLADIARLRSGVPNIFPPAKKAEKIVKLKKLMKFIFESELTTFKGDKKGDKSGETDGQFLRCIINSANEIKGWEFIDDELKISVGKNETYPAEDVQLLKKLVLNSLFLNCDYGSTSIRYITRTRSFFVAFGVAALEAHLLHRKIKLNAAPAISGPRGVGITRIATEVRDIFNNGAIWDVHEVVPGSSMQRKLLAFPGCSFTAIISKVRSLRNDYEQKLSAFLTKTTAGRVTDIVLNESQRNAHMALLLLKDYDAKSRNFSSCRSVYNLLKNQLKNALGDYLSGFKKSAFMAFYTAGGGTRGNAAWARVGAEVGTIRNAEPALSRMESYFVKTGLTKGGNSQNTGAGASSSPSAFLKKSLEAFEIYDLQLRAEILSAPDDARPHLRKIEALNNLLSPEIIKDIHAFVVGTGKAVVRSPRYTRREGAAVSPPKAGSIERRVLANANKYSSAANAAALRTAISSATPNQRTLAFLRLKTRVPENKMALLFENYANLKSRAERFERAMRLQQQESQGSNFNM